MTKEEFVKRRTEIISKMLDNPNNLGIYPTTKAFAELDDLFDQLIYDFKPAILLPKSKAQTLRDSLKNTVDAAIKYTDELELKEIESVVDLKHED